MLSITHTLHRKADRCNPVRFVFRAPFVRHGAQNSGKTAWYRKEQNVLKPHKYDKYSTSRKGVKMAFSRW